MSTLLALACAIPAATISLVSRLVPVIQQRQALQCLERLRGPGEPCDAAADISRVLNSLHDRQ